MPKLTYVITITEDEHRQRRRRAHRELFRHIPERAYRPQIGTIDVPDLPQRLDRVAGEDRIRDIVDDLLETDDKLISLIQMVQDHELGQLAKAADLVAGHNDGQAEFAFVAATAHLYELRPSERPSYDRHDAASTQSLGRVAGLLILADIIADDDEPRIWAA
ncbi:MAG: hypothetical protein RIB65_11230 [Ilumatobacter fluminis]|uniref:hypothetical protein n=1 Tax=Ilumatobacter fluminis TaxID=467091 RepID=UPI0032EB1ED5